VLAAFLGAKCALRHLTDWAWHDLRRTFATTLGEAGVSEVVPDAELNHRQAATQWCAGGVSASGAHAQTPGGDGGLGQHSERCY
jgi:hypothetical protein